MSNRDGFGNRGEFNIDKKTWSGWIGTNNQEASIGYKCPLAILVGYDGDKVYVVSIILENSSSKKITLDDADVQAILASIEGKQGQGSDWPY
jgi:hypothetical protein